jgi:ABC-type polysaccharide/polyol phosphate transport system ATPase subunit
MFIAECAASWRFLYESVAMTHVHLKNVDVSIPIYDSHALRLIRLPSFSTARVGTNTATRDHSVIKIHALKNLSLDAEEGDRICLIGHNGAGKSTLLRVVAGIYPPSQGSVDVRGRKFALLGGSIAINSDATGYENIRLIANLYDWPEDKYQDMVRDIEEFTELGVYLSMPTRIYSAGMQARLSFALATAQNPDILLIDEGIGAGDAQFQKKARERIQQFVSRARILLLASHAVDLCRAMCSKALVLSKGENVFFGSVDDGFKVYAELT